MREYDKETIEKLELYFDSILCLCAEGPEFLTDYEIRKAIEGEVNKAMDLIDKNRAKNQ